MIDLNSLKIGMKVWDLYFSTPGEISEIIPNSSYPIRVKIAGREFSYNREGKSVKGIMRRNLYFSDPIVTGLESPEKLIHTKELKALMQRTKLLEPDKSVNPEFGTYEYSTADVSGDEIDFWVCKATESIGFTQEHHDNYITLTGIDIMKTLRDLLNESIELIEQGNTNA